MDLSDKVWIPDAVAVWKSAEVIDFDPDQDRLTVLTEKGTQETIDKSLTLSYDKDHGMDFDDAFRMGDLNQAALLHLLQRRSLRNQIYTFTGDILLSVNPYKMIERLYEPMPKTEELNALSSEAQPHLYVLAARAYDVMFKEGLNGTSQAVLINGESGAGKTEAAKRIMAFLMELSQRQRKKVLEEAKKKRKKNLNPYANRKRRGKKNAKEKKGQKPENAAEDAPVDRNQSEIEKIILKTNPLLEAFGNARTIRNDNSSRFGKFVQLEYDQQGIIKGARTKHFLLEKSRITSHGRGERNYHVFYQMCAAFETNKDDPVFEDVQMLKSYKVYKYLQPVEQTDEDRIVGRNKASRARNLGARGRTTDGRDGVQRMANRATQYMKDHEAAIKKGDREWFGLTLKSLEDINLELHERKNVMKVLTAILVLGNLEFANGEVTLHGKVVPGTVVVEKIDPDTGESLLETCAKLLGVDPKPLDDALTKKTIMAAGRKSVSEKPLNVKDAEQSRDGLAKAMYEALFEWILRRVNRATGAALEDALDLFPGNKRRNKKAPKKSKHELFIGILDIFGFEMLEDNSFEQLCINYANETLQGMFDDHFFEIEKKGYEVEGVDLDFLDLKMRDNKTLLKMFNKKREGFFQLLDEQSRRINGNDGGFFKSLDSIHSKNERYKGSEHSKDGRFYFKVEHFAGVVEYTATGMVEKNSDHLQADLADLIALGGMPENNDEPAEEQRVRMMKSRQKEEKIAPELENEEQNLKGFAFLQNLLRQRERNAKDVDEDDKNEDKKKKKPRRGNKGKKMARLQSVSYKFRKQMSALQKLLSSTRQHFVRCIKPNDLKVPPLEKWDFGMVSQQLRMLGAYEMVRVRQEGFPVRTAFSSFIAKFPMILQELGIKAEITDEQSARESCVALLDKIAPDGKNRNWQLGDSKLFVREVIMRELNDRERAKMERLERLKRLKEEQERKAKMKGAQVTIAKTVRGFLVRNKLKKAHKAIARLQAKVRALITIRFLNKQKQSIVKIQALYRGYVIRNGYGKKNELALKVNPLVRGYLTRRKMRKIFECKKIYSKSLFPGEFVVLESFCVAGRSKRADATLTKSYCLLLTAGPLGPRILYVNRVNGKVLTELEWDETVLCGLMANEHRLILYTKPSKETDKENPDNKLRVPGQRLYKFTFARPAAALWLLTLREVITVRDILNLQKPNYESVIAQNPGVTKEIIRDHFNLLPFNQKTNGDWYFGGPSVLLGTSRVRLAAQGFLTQLSGWRKRLFVLKKNTLFWFPISESTGRPDYYPIGGIQLSAETTVDMATAKSKFFSGEQKQKSSLEIESRLLKESLKVSLSSTRERQNWVSRIRNAIREQGEVENRRMSLLRGELDNKAFTNMLRQVEIQDSAVESQHLDSDDQLQFEDDDNVGEDIEQGLDE